MYFCLHAVAKSLVPVLEAERTEADGMHRWLGLQTVSTQHHGQEPSVIFVYVANHVARLLLPIFKHVDGLHQCSLAQGVPTLPIVRLARAGVSASSKMGAHRSCVFLTFATMLSRTLCYPALKPSVLGLTACTDGLICRPS